MEARNENCSSEYDTDIYENTPTNTRDSQNSKVSFYRTEDGSLRYTRQGSYDLQDPEMWPEFPTLKEKTGKFIAKSNSLADKYDKLRRPQSTLSNMFRVPKYVKTWINGATENMEGIEAETNELASTAVDLVGVFKEAIDANPHLEPPEMLENSGGISAQNASKSIQGTPRVKSKRLKIEVFLILLIAISCVMKRSTHLLEGEKTESADLLREENAKLENLIEDLYKSYVNLHED